MKKVCAVLLLFIAVPTLAQSIVWNGKASSLRIGNRLSVLRDPTGALSIGQVSSPGFQTRFAHSNQIILNGGFTDAFFWLRFTVDNPTPDRLLLEVAQAFLPVAELYYRTDAGKWTKAVAGYRVPLDEKTVKSHYQVFPLPTGKHEYYVRFQAHSQPVPVTLWETSAYEIKTYKQRIVYGFYLGFMLYVLLTNLFFFFSLRNRMYLFYAFVVLIYVCYGLTVMDGFVVYFIDYLDLTFLYITIPTVGVVVQTMYCLLFLEAAKYTPRISRFVWGVVAYFAAYMVLKYFLPISVILAVNTVNALISFFLMGFVGIQVGRNGNRLGYYFALAYFIYFVLVLTEATYIQTGNPAYIAELSYVTFATLIESFVLSFLLSKRFEWEQRELTQAKAVAQQRLLEKTRENEQILLSQNEKLEREVAERTKTIEHKTVELQESLDNLKATQAQLLQQEKLASLGEMTAGIAHEIQNPLNFVTNFSAVSIELVNELKQELTSGNSTGIDAITRDLGNNLQRINQHGNRASNIVREMQDHSRTNAGQKTPTDLNKLVDDYLHIAYQDVLSKDKLFNADLQTDYDPQLGRVSIVPQDIARVILNLFTNAFYALREKQSHIADKSYQPTLLISTRKTEHQVILRIKDNGIGIPSDLLTKIYHPFFTTKPAGQGTGLGLSLSYDIIKGHSGEININTEQGQFTDVTVSLPLQ